MRDELLQGIEKLCWMFPQLKPSIRYSESLSRDEVDAFVAFVKGHVQGVLRKHPADEKSQEAELSAPCFCGVSKIHHRDVVLVGSLLSAASGKDTGISPEMRDMVDFLRVHRQIWWSLHGAYTKILKGNLLGTCPLTTSPPTFFDFVPFFSKTHESHDFHRLFHESIHFVLEENGICFGDEEIDEGLVTFLHEQVMGRQVCLLHYKGEEGKKYLRYSSVFEDALSPYPRSAVIPVLQRLNRSKAQ